MLVVILIRYLGRGSYRPLHSVVRGTPDEASGVGGLEEM
jgi:hypothetical protein